MDKIWLLILIVIIVVIILVFFSSRYKNQEKLKLQQQKGPYQCYITSSGDAYPARYNPQLGFQYINEKNNCTLDQLASYNNDYTGGSVCNEPTGICRDIMLGNPWRLINNVTAVGFTSSTGINMNQAMMEANNLDDCSGFISQNGIISYINNITVFTTSENLNSSLYLKPGNDIPSNLIKLKPEAFNGDDIADIYGSSNLYKCYYVPGQGVVPLKYNNNMVYCASFDGQNCLWGGPCDRQSLIEYENSPNPVSNITDPDSQSWNSPNLYTYYPGIVINNGKLTSFTGTNALSDAIQYANTNENAIGISEINNVFWVNSYGPGVDFVPFTGSYYSKPGSTVVPPSQGYAREQFQCYYIPSANNVVPLSYINDQVICASNDAIDCIWGGPCDPVSLQSYTQLKNSKLSPISTVPGSWAQKGLYTFYPGVVLSPGVGPIGFITSFNNLNQAIQYANNSDMAVGITQLGNTFYVNIYTQNSSFITNTGGNYYAKPDNPFNPRIVGVK